MLENSPTTSVLYILIILLQIGYTKQLLLSSDKVMTASSIYYDWVPERAIDNDTRSDPGVCSCCAATNVQLNPWYQLDLGQNYLVRRVTVQGRTDNDGQSLFNMQIFFSKIGVGHGLPNNPETTVMQVTKSVTYNAVPPLSTRYIIIVLRNITEHFTVCELKVFGECVDGKFGESCEGICHCAGEHCNKTSGICPDGECLPGFKGDRCDTVCEDGLYGANCTQDCGNCMNSTICDKINGTCPGNCSAGYQGDTCKHYCDEGFYGQDCSTLCGECTNGGSCHPVTGICENGCSDGYLTNYCNIECTPGMYGTNCTETCGKCQNNTVCMVINGTCPSGCLPGYQGRTCKTDCDNGSYGQDCLSLCGHCVNGTVCGPQTGICPDGCGPGYNGDSCNQTCTDGFYGDACNQTCGHCKDSDVCDKISGVCDRGCMAGFTTDFCSQECDDGQYGDGCLEECGHCFNGSICNKANGSCLACVDSYTGHDCKRMTSAAILGWVVWIVSGTAGLVVMVTVIPALIYCLWRRSTKTIPRKEEKEPSGGVAYVKDTKRLHDREGNECSEVSYVNDCQTLDKQGPDDAAEGWGYSKPIKARRS